jgi:hypothetical protein
MRTVGIILMLSVSWVLAACAGGGAPTPAGSRTSDAATPAVDPAGQSYVDAVQAKDLDKLVNSFAEDGVVIDVGRRIEGRQKIREWADNEVIGGAIEVLGRTPFDKGETLLVRFSPGGVGGFKANYKFTYRNGLIAQADLTYA